MGNSGAKSAISCRLSAVGRSQKSEARSQKLDGTGAHAGPVARPGGTRLFILCGQLLRAVRAHARSRASIVHEQGMADMALWPARMRSSAHGHALPTLKLLPASLAGWGLGRDAGCPLGAAPAGVGCPLGGAGCPLGATCMFARRQPGLEHPEGGANRCPNIARGTYNSVRWNDAPRCAAHSWPARRASSLQATTLVWRTTC
jgi:hypothetical protein